MSTPQFPTAIPILDVNSLRLRELDEDDIPSWFERATDAQSADLAGDPIPASPDLGHAWLQRHRDQFRKQMGIRWAVVPTASTLSVGTIGLSITQGAEKTANLGIVIARSWWSKGLASAAVRMVTEYAFSQLGLTEVRAEVLQRNYASIRLLEKTGFSLVRVLPPTPTEPETLLLYALSHPGNSAA